jgi:hypothetical protein
LNPNVLTLSQLAQRIDELEHLADKAPSEVLTNRLDELKKYYERKIKNKFNEGVVNPVPPDKIDTDNPYIITPKAPSQLDRERDLWEKSLE